MISVDIVRAVGLPRYPSNCQTIFRHYPYVVVKFGGKLVGKMTSEDKSSSPVFGLNLIIPQPSLNDPESSWLLSIILSSPNSPNQSCILFGFFLTSEAISRECFDRGGPSNTESSHWLPLNSPFEDLSPETPKILIKCACLNHASPHSIAIDGLGFLMNSNHSLALLRRFYAQSLDDAAVFMRFPRQYELYIELSDEHRQVIDSLAETIIRIRKQEIFARIDAIRRMVNHHHTDNELVDHNIDVNNECAVKAYLCDVTHGLDDVGQVLSCIVDSLEELSNE